MTNKISISKDELDIINKIVEENNLHFFNLVYTSGDGIGYCLDLEFDSYVNGREATTSIEVTGVGDW